MKLLKIFFFILFSIISCKKIDNTKELTWLKLNDNEKFKMIEKHFRGFDMAMIEVGYRYNELYWAIYFIGKKIIAMDRSNASPNLQSSNSYFYPVASQSNYGLGWTKLF